mgnify:CR=1 FL=1
MVNNCVEIAESLGIPHSNIFVMENGDSLLLAKHKILIGPHYPADPVYIDGKDIKGTNEAVIKDREIMHNDGLISVVVGINSKTGKIVVPARCITKAFISDDAHIVRRIEELVSTSLVELMNAKTTFGNIKSTIKKVVETYVYRKTERKPLIIPVVMDSNKWLF